MFLDINKNMKYIFSFMSKLKNNFILRCPLTRCIRKNISLEIETFGTFRSIFIRKQ